MLLLHYFPARMRHAFVVHDRLFTVNSGRQMKLDNRKKSFRCPAAQKFLTYYNIYKTGPKFTDIVLRFIIGYIIRSF